MILPMTYHSLEDKKRAVHTAVDMAKRIKDTKQMIIAITGICVFSDKIVERDYSLQIRRWLRMTQLGRIIEEEKQQAIKEAVAVYSEELENKDKQIASQKSLIEKLKAEVVKLGGNVAMF